jgi:hypothetical protein
MKPIIFSTPMVQAILDGRKTQTRRVIKYDFESVYSAASQQGIMDKVCQYGELPSDAIEWYAKNIAKPKYQPGDVLWVRETFCEVPYEHNHVPIKGGYITIPKYAYKADSERDYTGIWKPSIHMPREAARIFLRVKTVRVERLQEITEEDAIAEGVGDPYDYQSPEYYDQPHMRGLEINKSAFAGLWDSLNEKRGYGWRTNPWVWVIEFEREEVNHEPF